MLRNNNLLDTTMTAETKVEVVADETKTELRTIKDVMTGVTVREIT